MAADMYGEHPITEVGAMITDETRRKLREMKLDDFLAALDEQAERPDPYLSMNFDQRIDMIVDDFYQRRNSERAKRLLSHAKLRHPKADINTLYYEGRGMDRNKILSLATGNYISTCRNIIINGYTGSGKTHLACAFGKEACRRLHRTRYYRMPGLLEELNLADQTSGSISRTVTRLSNYHVLILDEWLVDIPSEREQHFLLEIFEKRYDQWPTIFCTQRKVSEWHPRLGGGVIADAIMDRIVHNSVTIDTGKINMRELLAQHDI